ncbi:hypothetical protein M5689_025300 [Euphorbia peplus]|nr:hypothetical protein M5689_025300 [Euphorbia peplus]
MNENSCCYFHPKEELVGICPLCLNERLLLLAAKQGHNRHIPSNSSRKPSIHLPKFFPFSSLLSRHWKSDHSDSKSDLPSPSSSSSPEDSFISIKFEGNGAALWEKGKNVNASNKTSFNPNLKQSKQGKDTTSDTKGTMSVIEHAKPRVGSLRWRKRIDHLFQVIKRKRSNRGNVCHVGSKVEGVKVMRKSWIRILTRRRTKE